MSAAHVQPMDFCGSAGGQKHRAGSLVVGLIFSAVSVAIAFLQPDEFFSAYLLSFMAWLGVTMGSLAILMIRH